MSKKPPSEKEREASRRRTRAWVAANPERKKAADTAYRTANAEKLRLYHKSRYQANKEKMAAASRENYLKNKDAYKERARKSLDKHRAEHYALVRARRVKKRDSVKKYLFKLQNGRCAYCRCKLDFAAMHIDHIMPVKLGGKNERSNYQLTCPSCNHTKCAKHPIAFAQSLGRLL